MSTAQGVPPQGGDPRLHYRQPEAMPQVVAAPPIPGAPETGAPTVEVPIATPQQAPTVPDGDASAQVSDAAAIHSREAVGIQHEVAAIQAAPEQTDEVPLSAGVFEAHMDDLNTPGDIEEELIRQMSRSGNVQ